MTYQAKGEFLQGSPMEGFQNPPPSYNNAPISMQPPLNKSMQQPVLSDFYTHGLEHLLEAETIRFKQEIQMMQIFCGCDMPINFDLTDQTDRNIYQVEERDDCCKRNCIPQGLRTQSVVSTSANAPVLTFKREARCVFGCCLPCCCYPLPFSRERLSVFAVAGNQLLGVVQQNFSAWRSRFTVLDASENAVLRIEGPGCNFGCGDDLEFSILAMNGSHVGSIVKHYNGFIKEIYTDFDNFTIQFPRNLEVKTKATLLGAVNLINFLFFQGGSRRLIANCCALGFVTLRLSAVQ